MPKIIRSRWAFFILFPDDGYQEAVLKETVLMLIEDQNMKGWLLGGKLESVVANPQFRLGPLAEKSRELLAKEKVAVVFGLLDIGLRKSVRRSSRNQWSPLLPGAVRR